MLLKFCPKNLLSSKECSRVDLSVAFLSPCPKFEAGEDTELLSDEVDDDTE